MKTVAPPFLSLLVSCLLASGAVAAPVVSLTAPANLASFTPGSTVTLTATATTSTGTIANVAFYNGATKLTDDAAAPYTYEWVNVPAGSYSLTAVATDSLSGQTTSAPVILNVETVGLYFTQNFDSMGTTGTAAPSGWSIKVANTGTANTTWTNSIPIPGSGTDSVASMVASSGVLTVSATPTVTNNNGFNAQNGATSGNRALATSPTTVAGVAIQWQVLNTSGAGISFINLGYDILRYAAAATPNELPGYQVFFSLDNGATFTNVSALNPTLDGSGGTVSVPNTAGTTTVPLTAINLNGVWNSNTYLFLRWVDDNATETSPDQILGLDNVTLSAGPMQREPYLQKSSPTGLTIRWRTIQPSIGRVQYGAAPGALTTSVLESAPVTDHEISLSGLTPNTTYFYNVGTDSAVLTGGDPGHTFTTPPVAGTVTDTRIWVLGDAGKADLNQTAVRDAFYNWTGTKTPNLVLQLGDNAYDTGTDTEFTSAVFNIYSKMTRKTTFWSCLGNHETAQATAYVDTYPYFSIYTLPTAGECGGVASGTEHYYSFNYANIHFVCLDSMTASRAVDNPATAGTNEDGPMAAWLRNDLGSNVASWTIAFWHHPPYSKGSHDSDAGGPNYDVQMGEMRQNFLPILESYGVDLVLSGHSHCYERSYLLDGHYGLSTTFTAAMKKDGGSGQPAGSGAYTKPLFGNVSHQGAVYAVAGSASQATFWASGSTAVNNPSPHPAMYVSLLQLGSLVIDVNGTTLNATFLRSNGAVADSFQIAKQPTAPLAVTQAATPVLDTTATLNATVNPAGLASTAKFQYGLTTAYGTDVPISLSPNDGVANQAASLPLTGLTPATTYHFRVSATNSVGTANGDDLTFTTFSTTAEIGVSQSGTSLVSGSGSVDFGAAIASYAQTSRIFTVVNTGLTNLLLGTISIDGTNGGDFSSTVPGTSTLTPGASTTFTVTFSPSAVGSRSAMLHLPSNDSNESPFNIALTGTGNLGTAVLAVQSPVGTNLTDGVSSLSYGTIGIGYDSAPKTFTVTNTGTAAVTNLGITINGTNAADFTASAPGSTTIAINASTTFTVIFNPSASGARSAALHLTRDPSDTNPFDISLTGTGSAGRTIAGTTAGTGKPKWNRPNSGGTGLSSTTAVPYEAQKFTVGTAGTYTVTSTSVSPAAWDNYLFLYRNSFSPTNQLNNFVIGNNNFPTVGIAGFNIALTPGITYYAVTTGNQNSNSGSYNLTINGPGTVAITPIESWRQIYFNGSVDNSGPSDDNADPDGDGLENLVEFAFGLNPLVNSAHLLPTPQFSGANIIYSFTQPASVSGITYGAESSPDMLPAHWTSLTDTGSGLNHVFTRSVTTGTKGYMRLKVTNP